MISNNDQTKTKWYTRYFTKWVILIDTINTRVLNEKWRVYRG